MWLKGGRLWWGDYCGVDIIGVGDWSFFRLELTGGGRIMCAQFPVFSRPTAFFPHIVHSHNLLAFLPFEPKLDLIFERFKRTAVFLEIFLHFSAFLKSRILHTIPAILLFGNGFRARTNEDQPQLDSRSFSPPCHAVDSLQPLIANSDFFQNFNPFPHFVNSVARTNQGQL